MKLVRGSIFHYQGERYRLCYVNGAAKTGMAVRMDATTLDFRTLSFGELDIAERPELRLATSKNTEPKQAWIRKAEASHAHIKPLLDLGADLFDRETRDATIAHLTREGTGRCARTLQNLLLRYFQRGMNLYALIPDYANCGTTAIAGLTNRRGNQSAYQVTDTDIAKFEKAKEYWLDDERRTIQNAYQWLGDNHYTYVDGNGDICKLPADERPSIHQFRRFLKRTVTTEVRIRRRHGEKTFLRDAKPTLASTINDCLGIAHIYEIDATIGDVLIVSNADRQTIIGKPTVYLIVDRRSRLIVGLYVGLDPASWETAIEAICSLVEPKGELCRRYGVKYDPADWPADGLLPESFLGDNSEMNSAFSTALAKRLGCEVANTESYLPNHKPNVESRHKLITITLRAKTPGYVPPENFGKRARKRYEKEACLTLDEFIKELLTAIIQYNRSPITAGEVRDPSQILRAVVPSPIELWHDGVLNGGGCMGHEMKLADVRLGLLPRDQASITGNGIAFRALTYESDHPAILAAITKARIAERRGHIEVSYDRRSVDMIWVHRGEPSREVVPVFLTRASGDYAGMSFREVEGIRAAARAQKPAHREMRDQAAFEANQQSSENIRNAEALRNDLGAVSISSRKKNTRAQRAADRHANNRAAADAARHEAAAESTTPTPSTADSKVIGLPVRNRFKNIDPARMTAAQKARMGAAKQ